MSNVDGTFGSEHILEHTELIKPNDAQKNAIINALNNTYAKNTNPEAIEKLIDAVESIYINTPTVALENVLGEENHMIIYLKPLNKLNSKD